MSSLRLPRNYLGDAYAPLVQTVGADIPVVRTLTHPVRPPPPASKVEGSGGTLALSSSLSHCVRGWVQSSSSYERLCERNSDADTVRDRASSHDTPDEPANYAALGAFGWDPVRACSVPTRDTSVTPAKGYIAPSSLCLSR